MPQFDKAAAYSISIHATPRHIYDAVRHADFSGSLLTRILFSLRSVDLTFSKKHRLNSSIDGLLRNGFILLEENSPHEIVLGLVGKFWTVSGCIQRIDSAEFIPFAHAGFAKVAWNFLITLQADGTTILSTETRIRCTDAVSRKKFFRYWFFIGPFSGLIRREMLRTIKRHIERR